MNFFECYYIESMHNLYNSIKYLIRQEYLVRSHILSNMSKHIDRMNEENIIHCTYRNKYMSELNDCLLKLNTSYNKLINEYKNTEYNLTDNEKYFINNNSPDILYEYLLIMNEFDKTSVGINIDFFKECDMKLVGLMRVIGCHKISDILNLTIGSHFRELLDVTSNLEQLRNYVIDNKTDLSLHTLLKKMHSSSALIDILDQHFNPIEVYCLKGMNRNSVLIKKFKHNGIQPIHNGSEESPKFKYEVMLENCYKITIKTKLPNRTYVIIGYFDYDVIGSSIATAQICNNFIYYKKKLLSEFIKNTIHIDDSYREVYLANLSLGEILCYTGKDLIVKIHEDYDLYNRTNNSKFKSTVNDFLKADMHKKFNILRCMLLGPKSSIKNGAMLFGMTKDQSRDQKNNNNAVSDILYRNLNHSQQQRLRKSGHYIKQEIDRIKKMTPDDLDLRQQCAMNNMMSDRIKKCVMNKLDEMKSNNNDYHKNYTYVKTLVAYPWISDKYTDVFTTIGKDNIKCREKLKQITNDLNKRVFGHTECKTIICDIVGKWFSNPNSMGKAIGLCGPPGVGKTLIASGLGDVLGIPCKEIHLGGIEDGSVLSGHSFTYSGAQPGLIVTQMVMAGEPRCILFFDELDKACTKHGINEVFNVLIHATDSNTNDKFSDKFFQDVSFPLNKCVFVFSFNDRSKIDPILLDRMEIIDIAPYSLNDKVTIAHDYLMKELLEGIGINEGSIQMDHPVIEYLITNYTVEAGVRSLKNKMEKIFLKLNMEKILGEGVFKKREAFSKTHPIKLTISNITKYLGKPNQNIDQIHPNNQIGVINGLYATTSGSGGIIPILVYPAKNNNRIFTIEMTGKQGKVMKESANFSWTIAKNCLKSNIIQQFYEASPGGIHIHTPDGATPKDGPSAGCAFTTAFISRITGCPIKHDVAMTGEIGIGGNITAIGGLGYKLVGAKSAGVRLVMCCKKNIDDIKKIKENNHTLFQIINPMNDPDVKNMMDSCCKKKGVNNENVLKIMIVETIFDVVKYALIDDEYCEANNCTTANTYKQTFDNAKWMICYNDGFHTSPAVVSGKNIFRKKERMETDSLEISDNAS